jgi:elongation of very long chain fatty acids protein 6
MSVTSTHPYEPIFSFHSIYPNLNWFFFSFEKNFKPDNVLIASKQHKALGPIFCVIYLFFVWFGPKYMKNKKPYNLRKPLQYWNLFMTIISTWGMLRVIPHIVLYISHVGFKNSFCFPPAIGFGHGALGFWSAVFIYSKVLESLNSQSILFELQFIELIDTVFLILRKRPLTFLHWYHHLTVLGFSWHAFIVEQPVGIYFCAMNYTGKFCRSQTYLFNICSTPHIKLFAFFELLTKTFLNVYN